MNNKNKNNLKVGIEIEVEFPDGTELDGFNYHSNRWFGWLRVESDGSLNHGLEFIIKHCTINTLLTRTKPILAAIAAFEGAFESTCGAHINVSSTNNYDVMKLYVSLLNNTSDSQNYHWFRSYAKSLISVSDFDKYNSLNIKFRRNNKKVYEIRSVNFYELSPFQAQKYLEKSLKNYKKYNFKTRTLIKHLKKLQQTLSSNIYSKIDINYWFFKNYERKRYLVISSESRSYLNDIDYKLYRNSMINLNSLSEFKDEVLGFVWVFTALDYLRWFKNNYLNKINKERRELAIENFKALFNKYGKFIEQEEMLKNFKALFNEEHILDISKNYNNNTQKVVIKNV